MDAQAGIGASCLDNHTAMGGREALAKSAITGTGATVPNAI